MAASSTAAASAGGVARFTLEPVLRVSGSGGPGDFGGAGALRVAAVDAWGARLVLAAADARLLVFAPAPPAEAAALQAAAAAAAAAAADEAEGEEGANPEAEARSLQAALPGAAAYTVMEEHCNFRGKKAVAQLAVVDSAGLMLTLVESMGVQAHALLPSLREAAPVLAKSKGAACFAWADGATQSDAARLAVGVKKRVLVYSAANGDAASLVESADVGAPDSVKALAWGGGDALVVGTKREYCIIDARTGAVTELFAAGRAAPPLVVSLPALAGGGAGEGVGVGANAGEALVQRDATSVFVSGAAKAGGAGAGVSRAHGLTWSAAPNALAAALPYVVAVTPAGVEVRSLTRNTLVQAVGVAGLKMLSRGAGGAAAVFAAGDQTVWRLSARPLLEQARALLTAGETEEALAVCAQVSSSAQQAERAALEREASCAHARGLFAQAQYEEALSFFSHAKADPVEVLELYPTLGVKAAEQQHTHSTHAHAQGPQSMALAALLPFLMEARERMGMLEELRTDADGSNPFLDVAPTIAEAEEEVFDPEAVEVDTAIVQALVGTGLPDEGVAGFLRERNAADARAIELCLQSAGRHAVLLELYRVRGMDRQALEHLQALATTGDGGTIAVGSDAAGDTHTFGPDATTDYLLELRARAARQAPERQAETEALLLEFSAPLLRRAGAENTDAALRLLRELEPPLPAARALAHVRAHAPSLAAAFLEDELTRRGERAPAELHDELALAYLAKARAEASSAAGTSGETLKPNAEVLTAPRVKLRGMIRDPVSRLRADRLLAALPPAAGGEFLEERADVLARLAPPQHARALRLLCRRRRRPELAHAYVSRVAAWGDGEQREEVCQALLQVLLDPQAGRCAEDEREPDGEEGGAGAGAARDGVMLDEALLTLEKYAYALDASAAVGALPDGAALRDALPFLRTAIVAGGERRREAAASRSLARAEALASSAERVELRSRRVTVAADAACAVCFKRLSTAAFVERGGQLVHFRCVKEDLKATNTGDAALQTLLG